ncbi:hypothetical protein Aca07nite_78380 [Actinoplanes capillaceus]|uniref:Uncharacterized protein n=1 Tax=Actinoplanes campanulatus TaxID=113559 RepID=A0ABQ3WW87_9ACTN|nr:hypothetical protein Aca07nite_78380 [Actinoplanes capillaceus]
MSVDLPLPDGPMIAVKRPLPNSTLTPRSAATRASPEPYTFQIASARAATGPPAFVGATTVCLPLWNSFVSGPVLRRKPPRASPCGGRAGGDFPRGGTQGTLREAPEADRV